MVAVVEVMKSGKIMKVLKLKLTGIVNQFGLGCERK